MATFNKFNDFVERLANGTHVFGTHQFKIAWTNTAPVASNSVLTDITQITAKNGYVAGGFAIPNCVMSETSGTATVAGDKVTLTADTSTDGTGIGPFRYAVMYNNTATNKNLVAWWDYGSSITLNNTETFDWKPNNADTNGTIFTLV